VIVVERGRKSAMDHILVTSVEDMGTSAASGCNLQRAVALMWADFNSTETRGMKVKWPKGQSAIRLVALMGEIRIFVREILSRCGGVPLTASQTYRETPKNYQS
jgi:hypothetical protein